jgi:hypothetical protein
LAQTFILKETAMYTGFYTPYYRRWGYPYYSHWYVPGGYGRYYGNYGNNIIGSAVANQNMNVIGSTGFIGTQTASPSVIW